MTADIVLARATEADGADCALLHAAAMPALGQQPWPRGALCDLLALPAAIGFTLRRGGRLLAFLLAQGAAGEAEILTLATNPQERRRGHAQALIGILAAYYKAAGTTRLFLEVREDNEAALALYEKTGFRRIGLRPSYYRDLRDGNWRSAVLMCRELGKREN
jgi:ribosomal-protein-alanine N-acetyltransferase